MTQRIPMASSFLVLLAVLLSACSAPGPHSAKPVIFEDIHYFATDPDASGVFFQKHFGARLMAHPGRPQEYVDFWALRSGEVPITISPIGPYRTTPPESTFWSSKEIIPPSPDNNAYYGVYSVGIATPSLSETISKIKESGVNLATQHIPLPHESTVPTQTIFGPDYNLFTLVERRDMRAGYGGFGVDHVHLLVRDKDETVRFYQDVFFGEEIWSNSNSAVLRIVDMLFILSEPEALGLDRTSVEERDYVKKVRYGVGHIGWLSTDMQAFIDHVDSTDYKFGVRPARFYLEGERTVYTLGLLLTPNVLSTEILQEDGRHSARTVFADSEDLPPAPSAGFQYQITPEEYGATK
ncbi:MAG: hypothetical protein GKS03_10340 [Alphaproteobacteria bacterium]|nr:hypothetical protein [Alphaproteobacteria bacterium]